MDIKPWYRVPISRIVVFFGLFSFFRPTIFEKYTATNNIFNGVLILALLLCVLDYFRRGNTLKNMFLVLALLFYGIMAVATLNNHGSLSRMAMYVAIGTFSVVLAIYTIQYEFLFATRLMRTLLWIYTIVNIATIALFPDGIVQTGTTQAPVYFLGQTTRFSFFYLPALLFCYLGDEYEKGRIRVNTVVIYGICVATLIISWSVGSALSLLLLVVFFFCHQLKIMNVVVYYVSQLFGYFGLTYYSIQTIFEEFITGILKKDMTMSSRTRIWKVALTDLQKSPWLGYGVLSNDDMKFKIGFVHVHNHLLQMTFQCGYLGLSAFLLLLLNAYMRLKKHWKFKPAKILAFFLFMIGIQLLVDTVDGVRNHYIFIIAMGASIEELYRVFEQKKGRCK